MRDVRMRGFAERADVEEVELRLAGLTAPLGPEPVALERCAGRVLAADVTAPVDVPSFRRAAMDGYALRGEETFGASPYAPISFTVIGESYPGHGFGGDVSVGEAVRIMTGAPMPAGADAVAPAEICRAGDDASARAVAVTEPVAPLRHVGAIGEDVRQGDVVLRRGRRLRPQDAGLLASLGIAPVPCVRKPRVEIITVGDELLPPGSRPEGTRIVDSNSVTLRGLVERDGGVVTAAQLLSDDRERLGRAMATSRADVLLVSGGSSVGQEDHAPRLLAELGSLDFHGVSMRPSSPAGGGRIDGRLVFLLPGNPVSSLCAYEFFAGPSIRALGGRSRAWPHRRATSFPWLTPLILDKNLIGVIYNPLEIHKPLEINLIPENDIFSVENNSKVIVKDENTLSIKRDWINNKNKIIVNGEIPYLNFADTTYFNLVDANRFFLDAFKNNLISNGIKIEGILKPVKEISDTTHLITSKKNYVNEMMINMNKKSDNLSAEMLLRLLGTLDKSKSISADDGIKYVDSLISIASPESKNFRIVDGSGVSHYNLVTAKILNDVINFIYKKGKGKFEVLKRSLPVAGIDGSLKNRMTESIAKGRVFAKTGTLSGVSTLTGYAYNKKGHLISFSILIQNYVGSSHYARNIQDKICEIICESE